MSYTAVCCAGMYDIYTQYVDNNPMLLNIGRPRTITRPAINNQQPSHSKRCLLDSTTGPSDVATTRRILVQVSQHWSDDNKFNSNERRDAIRTLPAPEYTCLHRNSLLF